MATPTPLSTAASASELAETLIKREPKDWLLDGRPIKGEVMLAKFENLDWSKAWVDLGPSVAGNPGPYWHVPLNKTIVNGEIYADGDTTHRLYPKLPRTTASDLVFEAVFIYGEKLREKSERLRQPVAGDASDLVKALEDAVAVIRGEIGGPAQIKGILADAESALTRHRQGEK